MSDDPKFSSANDLKKEIDRLFQEAVPSVSSRIETLRLLMGSFDVQITYLERVYLETNPETFAQELAAKDSDIASTIHRIVELAEEIDGNARTTEEDRKKFDEVRSGWDSLHHRASVLYNKANTSASCFGSLLLFITSVSAISGGIWHFLG